jgi:eukaryotic-like serine/threonine-protein kinase
VIARHLELGGDADGAAERYLRAADHAALVGGNADALRQLSRALKLLPAGDHERRYAAHRQREDLLRRLARRPQQLREIHNLKREAAALRDATRLSTAHALLAQFYLDVGKSAAAAEAAEPALRFARDAKDPIAEAEALRLKALIAQATGGGEEALALTEKALALCDDERDGLLQRAYILNSRGTILWNRARLQDSIEAYAETLVIYRMLGLPRREAQALNNMGVVFAQLGEFEEALAHYKSSLKIDQKLGNRYSIALKLGNIGQAYADLGDLERAERYLRKGYKLAEQTDDQSSLTDVGITLGQVHLQRRDLHRAIEAFETGLARAKAMGHRYQEVRALDYLALAQLEAEMSAEEALEHTKSAVAIARDMPMPVGEIYGLAIQARALERLGRADEAVKASRRAIELLDAAAHPTGKEQILHFHAGVCEAAGQLEEARDAIARARAEVKAKAARLKSRELRDSYLQSSVPMDIARSCARLLAS